MPYLIYVPSLAGSPFLSDVQPEKMEHDWVDLGIYRVRKETIVAYQWKEPKKEKEPEPKPSRNEDRDGLGRVLDRLQREQDKAAGRPKGLSRGGQPVERKKRGP